MKIKLVKPVNFLGMTEAVPENSIVEVDETQGKKAMEEGNAIEFTSDIEKQELEIAKKEIQIMSKQDVVVTDEVKRMQDDENIVGKAFQAVALSNPEFKAAMEQKLGSKAVAGMAESVSASGTNLVVTGINQLLGKVMAESEIVNAVRKVTLGEQNGSIRIPYETSNWWDFDTAPTATSGVEGNVMSPSVLTIGGTDVYPRTQGILAAVSAELLEDVSELSGEITRVISMKMPKLIESRILVSGTSASGANGFDAILQGDSAAKVSSQTLASLAAPTVVELQGFIAKIIPSLRPNCKWYMSNAFWAALKGSTAIVTAANIQKMLIDFDANKLLGYPVVVCECLPASAPVLFGDMSNYALVEARGGTQLLFSRELYFTSNQLAYRITKRCGGTLAMAKYTLADNSTVSSFCKASIAGS